MGYIKEPKNVDLIVGPSILTEASKLSITQAIAGYRETGQKPVSVKIDSVNEPAYTYRAKTTAVRSARVLKKKAKL